MLRVAILILVVLLSKHAVADDRFALIVGNEKYHPSGIFGRLANVPNDLNILRSALLQAGFTAENIRIVTDASEQIIRREVRQFSQKLRASGANGIGFFYYAGHGSEIDNVNFLIPSNVAINSREAARVNGIAAQDIISDIQAAGNRINIIIFDACRDDPFDRSGAGRGGLAPIMAGTRGTIIAFSAAAREKAEDGLYARILAEELVRPGIRVDDMLRQVRLRVSSANRRQTPYFDDRLDGSNWSFMPVPRWEQPSPSQRQEPPYISQQQREPPYISQQQSREMRRIAHRDQSNERWQGRPELDRTSLSEIREDWTSFYVTGTDNTGNVRTYYIEGEARIAKSSNWFSSTEYLEFRSMKLRVFVGTYGPVVQLWIKYAEQPCSRNSNLSWCLSDNVVNLGMNGSTLRQGMIIPLPDMKFEFRRPANNITVFWLAFGLATQSGSYLPAHNN